MSMRKRIIASIEARMTSTRLPGKVLMQCCGKPILDLLVERVKRSQYINEIVVATTVNGADDVLVEESKKLGIHYYRGDEYDVVERVVGAMQKYKAEIVVQLTGDCPLLDPEIIDQVVRLYMFNNFDYVSNTLIRSYPRGLDVQVSNLSILEESLRIARDAPQHEHLYLSIYENPDKYKLFNVFAPVELCRPDYRWTLDTLGDYNFIEAVFKNLYKSKPQFTSKDIIDFLKIHPEIVALNNDVEQKRVR